MKNLLKSVLFIAALFATFGNVNATTEITVPPHLPEDLNYIIVPSGTSVSLELDETINSEMVEVGHTITLVVRNNVVVNQTVVIRAGSTAEGMVRKVDKACNHCSSCDSPCSQVTITVEAVQAVDNSWINLNGRQHTMRGKCCGTGPSVINIGTRLSARTRDNSTVRL